MYRVPTQRRESVFACVTVGRAELAERAQDWLQTHALVFFFPQEAGVMDVCRPQLWMRDRFRKQLRLIHGFLRSCSKKNLPVGDTVYKINTEKNMYR